ncbi:MAG: 5'/3'-nucleotidase SurE [Chloroflexota bacterium]
MKILVTNDDGIFADGLWTLANELVKIAEVVVVAPDREQSAIGTAVTLSHPLRIQQASTLVPGIEACSVQGTPGDSVILALEKLFHKKIDLVVSGINNGLNLGNDVLISGTVGAALQGYLRGIPALAVSLASIEKTSLENAAKVTALIAGNIISNSPGNVFFNVNLPDFPPPEIKGARMTRLAGESHIDTVEEGHDGRRAYYWLVRRRINNSKDNVTDIGAIEQGYISITPLHLYLNNKHSRIKTDGFLDGLNEWLKNKE